jgi:hypothetical protein
LAEYSIRTGLHTKLIDGGNSQATKMPLKSLQID